MDDHAKKLRMIELARDGRIRTPEEEEEFQALRAWYRERFGGDKPIKERQMPFIDYGPCRRVAKLLAELTDREDWYSTYALSGKAIDYRELTDRQGFVFALAWLLGKGHVEQRRDKEELIRLTETGWQYANGNQALHVVVG